MKPTEPEIIRDVAALQAWSDAARGRGERVALVPTMGFLHEGHLSLVRLAREHAQRVAVSIFVNPTQFGPGEDFEQYPRDLEADVAKLRAVGVDTVFAPAVTSIYPPGDCTWVEVDKLGEGLCGRGRPGHFRGVTTVVSRLFHAARPHLAVFGAKDYQQLQIIRRMTRDLGFGIEIVAGQTVREADGLALSSRNAYLGAEARRQAVALSTGLAEARSLFDSGERDARNLIAAVRRCVEKQPLAEIEYTELRCAESLADLAGRERVDVSCVLALAVRFEGTRLIDNAVLEVR